MYKVKKNYELATPSKRKIREDWAQAWRRKATKNVINK